MTYVCRACKTKKCVVVTYYDPKEKHQFKAPDSCPYGANCPTEWRDYNVTHEEQPF